MTIPDQPIRQQTSLGNTGLRCSLVGLGCGGASRLGLRKGYSMEQAADVVRHALDLGISFIDTSRLYGTEPAVGLALKGRREGIVLSTKLVPLTPEGQTDPLYIEAQLEDSLRKLQVEHIDFVHLHGVLPRDYDAIVNTCLEPLQKARQEGKIGFIGISEFWNDDLTHKSLQRIIADELVDAVLVGCNLINASAKKTVLPQARAKGIATILMFVVRKTLAHPEMLKTLCQQLAAQGQIDPAKVDLENPLGFLLDAGIGSLTEAAYRYCRHLDGVDVVLTGTSNKEHLEANIAAIEKPPLPDQLIRRLDDIFARVDSTTGEVRAPG